MARRVSTRCSASTRIPGAPRARSSQRAASRVGGGAGVIAPRESRGLPVAGDAPAPAYALGEDVVERGLVDRRRALGAFVLEADAPTRGLHRLAGAELAHQVHLGEEPLGLQPIRLRVAVADDGVDLGELFDDDDGLLAEAAAHEEHVLEGDAFQRDREQAAKRHEIDLAPVIARDHGKAGKAAGLNIQPELIAGALIPLVLWLVWTATRRIHERLYSGY